MAAARFSDQGGLGLDTTDVYPGLHQISREQAIAAADYLSRLLIESPHDTRISLDVTDPDPLFPYLVIGSELIEELLVIDNHASTMSTSLTQDYGAITSPISTTSYQTPHAPQSSYTPYNLPTPSQAAPPTWPSQINGTTISATTTPGDPKQCPACQAHFNRKQDCDRHIETHLPHWIHCPFPNCNWRGNRVKPFEIHWENDHGSHSHIPGREQFEIFNTQEFVNQIKAGTPLSVVTDSAIERVRAKAHQLGKMSMSTNPWGWTFKQPPQ